jgi:sigma-B regulation protein RsbU (phosphoserine phosphatase)
MNRILVVEDDPDAREALETFLSNRGYETVVADTGDAAVEIAAAFRPDVLLCDWRLPGTRDGVSVARELQAEHDVPVVFFTAHSISELRTITRDLNVLAYLPKPIDILRLTTVLTAAG